MNTDKVQSHEDHHYAHHFKSADHEFQSSILGVWLFLCTEILTFGGLFVAYAIFHSLYPHMFAEGATHLNWKFGATNTVVLLMSSFTMASAIYAAQTNNQKKCVINLALTILCGAIFMCIKYVEYEHKIHMGLLPGKLFHYAHAEHSNLALYFSLYFMMTGLHGLHVLIGMCLITWILIRARRGEFNSHYYTPVEGVGLFWHLVDLIWIYLFPLLYLVG
jgi:cytochrome c oxidase subunit 3